MAKGVYRFELDWGRHGNLESLFVADADVVARVKTKRLYFGSCFGKYSEVCVDPDDKFATWTLVTEDPDVVRMVELYGLATGRNPLNYVNEDDEEEEDDNDDE